MYCSIIGMNPASTISLIGRFVTDSAVNFLIYDMRIGVRLGFVLSNWGMAYILCGIVY